VLDVANVADPKERPAVWTDARRCCSPPQAATSASPLR